MDRQRLQQQPVDGLARVQRTVGVLEHHLHFAIERLVAARAELLAVDRDLAADTGASPAIARSSVDLPDPDSPTSPKDSPFATSRLTPFSA